MQTIAMSSDQARTNWAEMIEKTLAGDVISIERYGRPVSIVISARMWQQILADYERLDDIEAKLAYYRALYEKATGQSDATIIPDEEIEAWIAADAKIPA